MRHVYAIAPAVFAMALVLGACASSLGRPADLTPAELYHAAQDAGGRRDRVAQAQLLERAERQGAGTFFGVLATLQRHHLGARALRAATPGAPGAHRTSPSPLQRCAP